MNLKLQGINFIKSLSMAALSYRNPASTRELGQFEAPLCNEAKLWGKKQAIHAWGMQPSYAIQQPCRDMIKWIFSRCTHYCGHHNENLLIQL
jgi:hypothetical protein